MPIATVFFVQYAYLIIFLWVLMEQLGIPIPSVPVLLTAGTLSATHRVSRTSTSACRCSPPASSPTSSGSIFGRRYGNSVLKLLCRLSFEASTCVSKTEGYFNRRGATTLLFAKFVPGLSTVAAPIAGQTGMSIPRFLAWDLAGSLIWGETFILAGRFFGDLAKKSGPFFAWLGHFAIVIFVLMVLGFLTSTASGSSASSSSRSASFASSPPNSKRCSTAPRRTTPWRPSSSTSATRSTTSPIPASCPAPSASAPTSSKQHSEIIPRDRDVILYCTCPSEETSAKLALQLHKMGVYRVRPLRGGFDGWKQAGYPLVDYVTDTPTTPVVQQILPANTGSAIPLV